MSVNSIAFKYGKSLSYKACDTRNSVNILHGTGTSRSRDIDRRKLANQSKAQVWSAAIRFGRWAVGGYFVIEHQHSERCHCGNSRSTSVTIAEAAIAI